MTRLAAPADAARWWADAPGNGASLRARLQAADAALAAAFWAGEPVDTLVAARAWVIEQEVLRCWQAHVDPASGHTLLAVGGFGRGELFPRSDVDLLVLSSEHTEAASAALERFFAALWDAGLAVGHAVRTPEECGELAAHDVSVATNLMESRRLTGPRALVECMRTLTDAPAQWRAEAYAAAKLAEQDARHGRFHDTAYNLEPNLKEGPGGLRDLHTAMWIARRQLGRIGLPALRDAGLLGTEEYERLEAARRTLTRIRFGLHLVAGRAEERLLFEHQRELAQRFGHRDEHAQNLAVEQFMQGYYRAAMTVERLTERLLQRLDEALRGDVEPQPLDDDFVSVAGFLDTREPTLFERRPSAILRAFLRLLERPELHGFRSTLLRRLEAVLPGLDAGFRADPETQAAFLAILRHPGDVAGTLARLSRYGVLGRFVPAFGRVAGRMQYDLFHVYTVDQHTLFVLRNIRRYGDPTAAEGFPLAHELYQRLRKPELLLLAGLFHDIAKGRGGDHSVLGEQDAREFMNGLGFSVTDTDLVAWLVREHLVMSVTAQKRDIGDPAVVHAFAVTVGERERLDYLYLLTVADIVGTSPRLWNGFKAKLLADLYQATRYALRRGLMHPVHVSERSAETRQQALARLRDGGIDATRAEELWRDFPEDSFLRYSADQVAWLTRSVLEAGPDALPLVAAREAHERGAGEVFVYSPDRDGLFATITAALDRQNLSVVEARIVNSRRGISLDTFVVLEPDGKPLADPERMRTLERCLHEALSRPVLDLQPARRSWTRQQRQFHVPLAIEFQTQGARTQMALVCSDRPGLLAHVARAFRECALRVHDARIATWGERVEDFFLLTDEQDRPLDAQREIALRAAIEAELDRGRPDPIPARSTNVHA
jgi:[protein-PII] uridylyltransferase